MLPEVEGRGRRQRDRLGERCPKDCRSCLRGATEPASACGMSRQVRDVLGFAAVPQRIMPPEAGMCRITSKQATKITIVDICTDCRGPRSNSKQESEALIPICLVNVECVCMHYCEILGSVVENFS